ncbi:MAG: MBOAT family protein [Planctomycetes bacterium]|nr:MBOAT family protein [Planctomycetota bacterium]
MLFSSPIFLFLFLPLVLAGNFALPTRWRNAWLLGASLLFYGWGEPIFALFMLLSIGANWVFGLSVQRLRDRPSRAKAVVALAVVFNLGLLGYFKYADFVWEQLGLALHALGVIDGPLPRAGILLGDSEFVTTNLITQAGAIRLPIGISFFTFHALSYVIDIYRRDSDAQQNPVGFALYLSLFPQLIAGPILRYKDIAPQLSTRKVTLDGFAYGVRRFVVGLGKKCLIANVCFVPVDRIFALGAGELTTELAWIGITCYCLHLFYDFSGYSDMAIGLGHMVGFRFRENFDMPFVSRSITEFWRRWHISLSTWFRDYLYISLGGNRVAAWRASFNLILTFTLCGLWHGASWNFLIFGFLHGVLLVLERRPAFARVLEWPVLPHLYVLGVLVVSWVLFNCRDLAHAGWFLGALGGAGEFSSVLHPIGRHMQPVHWCALVAGVFFALPYASRLAAWRDGVIASSARSPRAQALQVARTAALFLLFWFSAAELAGSTFNPFVYFRF